jgi:tetratricopeptide (TPR) repeat protein
MHNNIKEAMNMDNRVEKIKGVIYRLKRSELVHIFRGFEYKIKDLDDLDIRTCLLMEIESEQTMMQELILSIFMAGLEKLQKTYYRAKKEEDAKRINELYLRITGKTAYLNNNMAVELIMEKEYDEALPLLEKAVRQIMSESGLDHDAGGIMDNYFCTLFNLKEYGQVISACTTLIAKVERKSGPPWLKKEVLSVIWLALGDAYLKSMMKEEALGVYMQAYMTDPGSIFVKLSLAKYYDEINDYDSVKKLCGEVIKKDKTCSEAYFQLAMAHVFCGEREEAKKCLYEAYKLDPRDLATKSNLLHCMYELGKVRVPTNCDEDDFIDELAESGEGDTIIANECGTAGVEPIRNMIEDIFKKD